MLSEELTREIVESLKRTNPRKIILFGSYADGVPGPESDIDLLVVTDDDHLPASFAEKNAIYLRVANSIIEIEKRMPIDLIVHTKAMHENFIKMGSVFSRMIASRGAVLYEKTH